MPKEESQDLQKFIEKYEQLDDKGQTILSVAANALLARQSFEESKEVSK